jgi:hypothetical protein
LSDNGQERTKKNKELFVAIRVNKAGDGSKVALQTSSYQLTRDGGTRLASVNGH